HLKAQCKGQPRCLICGEKAHANKQECPRRDSPLSCINCKAPHKLTDPSCLEYINQKKIR
ncbi:hypothetical protein EAG_15641, partial [Camponotus floridanus]